MASMTIIIKVFSSLSNQDGEEVVERALERAVESDGSLGAFFVRDLNCYSSSGLGLGTCGCHSHDPYDIRPATVEELAEAGVNLTRGEEFDQRLAVARVAGDDLVEFCRLSYRLGSNPLPRLRKLLPGWEIIFAHDSGASYAWEEGDPPTVVVWLADDGDDVRIEVFTS